MPHPVQPIPAWAALVMATALLGFPVAAAAEAAPAPAPPAAVAPAVEPLTWVPWSDDVFARAKREHKLVLLDLEAVWCHWCHVMAETTYRDPAVAAVLRKRYLLVRVDQDARPDLANRYEDYGWPATVVFDGDGRELAKRRGYIPPAAMASMVQAFADDPTPGPSVSAVRRAGRRGARRRAAAARRSARRCSTPGARLRPRAGGWGTATSTSTGTASSTGAAALRPGTTRRGASMARGTLDAARALIDPVWGGVYQYSAGGDLERAALREDHGLPGRHTAHLRAGLRAAGTAPRTWPRRRRCGDTCAIPHRPRGRLPHQPGRRPGAGRAQRGVFRARRRGPARARHPARRHAHLRARERLGDRRRWSRTRRHRRRHGARRRRARRRLGAREPRVAGRRLQPRRERRGRALPRRHPGHGPRGARASTPRPARARGSLSPAPPRASSP